MSNKIFQLIPQAIGKIGSIGKNGTNQHQNYKFRSIDDMYNKISPVLPTLGLFFVPQVLETKEEIFTSVSKDKYGNEKTSRSIRVKQKIKYMICADDGSFIDAIVEGEAIDSSDKATNKAMTAAFKYMLIQVLCIAIEDLDDADKDSPEIPVKKENTKSKTIIDLNKLKPTIQLEEIQTPYEFENPHVKFNEEQRKEYNNIKPTATTQKAPETKKTIIEPPKVKKPSQGLLIEIMQLAEKRGISVDILKRSLAELFNVSSSKDLGLDQAMMLKDILTQNKSPDDFISDCLAFKEWMKQNEPTKI